MDIEKEFPARFYMNLNKRADRRESMRAQLETLPFDVERLPAVNARWLQAREPLALPELGYGSRATGRYSTPGRYAVSLTRRLAVRRAALARAKAVLIFEDDAIFADDFMEKVGKIELPDDWGMFYFGCLHITNPIRVSGGGGIVKVTRAVDTHAFAVRADYFRAVIRATAPWGHRSEKKLRNSDVLISDLHATVPTYAAEQNLVWQAEGSSDLAGRVYSNYDAEGNQIFLRDRAIPEPQLNSEAR